ncbi:YheC/YheD family endospore coat-associated protein [Paenibacillus cellulositrophicus]|uniref:YheC/YheD family endospore coat-associated protein n=1 Tax=Paenibacillus cellulositrophicus TaxID=562959 RepID=UPI003F7F19F2
MWISDVGILLNAAVHRGIPGGKTGAESLANFDEAARMFGLNACYMRLQDIDIDHRECTAFVLRGGKYVQTRLPLPKVIHNRAIYFDARSKNRIERLLNEGYIIFNGYNRYGKDEIHHLLAADPLLAQHLPYTTAAAPSSIQDMMRRYRDLILKPCTGSVGRGIMRLHASGPYWYLTYARTGRTRGWTTVRLHNHRLPGILLRRISQVPFLVQERIALAEYKQRPYDLRVSIQRGINGSWSLTGMYAKVAASRMFVSNVAQGGKAFPAEPILAKSLPGIPVNSVVDSVQHLAFRVVRQLEQHLPFIADLGLDIGVTASGKPYFIECNGRDQRYGFQKAGMHQQWKNTYREPMAYARYLVNRQHAGAAL